MRGILVKVGQVASVILLSIVGAGAAFCAGGAGASVPPANSVYVSGPYPVLFSLASAGTNPITDPTASPTGANNWSCRPSTQHPDPVVLVHGLAATMGDNWSTMAPLLADNGYCVYALTYGLDPGENSVGGLQAMEVSSHQLADFVDRVLASTGASKIDLVGHSEGTVMPQYYLKVLGGAAKVNRYVAIAPLYEGTTMYGLSTGLSALERYSPSLAAPIESAVASDCGSCQEFLKGSPFLTDLYRDGVFAVPGVTYTTIMTRYDELVVPYTSGVLNAPNATNLVVQDQCPLDFSEHATLAWDPVVGQDILNALDPGAVQPVPCTLVLPGVGAPAFPESSVHRPIPTRRRPLEAAPRIVIGVTWPVQAGIQHLGPMMRLSHDHMNQRTEAIALAIKQTGLRVVVAAGMPRSGSTWQFNALRLLLESSGPGVYSFWFEDMDREKARQARILLVKIHEISYVLANASWRCFTCHRDLRDVAVSAMDLARVDGYQPDLVSMMQGNREAHAFWCRMCVLDSPYEQIVADPEGTLRALAASIDIPIAETEVRRICQSVASLSDGDVPSGYPHNPVTLLHRQHFFDGSSGRHRGVLDDATARRIIDDNAAWMSRYGYV